MSKFTLLRHRKLTDVIAVPEGLCELMKDITREVIRFQPADVERFIADYLESMVISRELIYISEKTMNDVFDSSLQIAEILKKEGVAFGKAEIGVRIIRQEIESNFNESKYVRKSKIIKRLIVECNLSERKAEKITNIVEDSMEHYRMRNSCCLKNFPKFMHHQAVKNTLNIHLHPNSLDRTSETLEFIDENANWIQANFLRRENAATKIRAWILGNKERRNFMKRKIAANKIQSWYLAKKQRREFQTMKNSANVIKSAFRGHLEKKKLKFDDNNPVEI
jgi:hypothetical protein